MIGGKVSAERSSSKVRASKSLTAAEGGIGFGW